MAHQEKLRESTRLENILISRFFLCVIFCAGTGTFIISSNEQSLPEEMPGAGNRQNLSSYYEEGFFLRDELIKLHNHVKYTLFKISPVPRVIVGKEGWLFQARENRNPKHPQYIPSIQPFTSKELNQWRRVYEQRRFWLEQQGIFYLLIITPDKQSIYPEYLPDSLQLLYKKSRIDQLVRILNKRTDVPVLDLRKTLLREKNGFDLYLKTDSHWNEYGAYFAYSRIIEYLASAYPGAEDAVPLPESGFRLKRKMMKGGNLAAMLSMEDSLFKEERILFLPRESFPWVKEKTPRLKIGRGVKSELTICEAADFPPAVMFHDSFSRKLKPFLSSHFSRILYLRDWGFRFKPQVIEQEKPRIVMDQITEHFLYNRKIKNPKEVKRFYSGQKGRRNE